MRDFLNQASSLTYEKVYLNSNQILETVLFDTLIIWNRNEKIVFIR